MTSRIVDHDDSLANIQNAIYIINANQGRSGFRIIWSLRKRFHNLLQKAHGSVLMTTSPPISIVILSLNKLAHTRLCVGSLLATDYPQLEIVVVDNGSTDGSVAWLNDFKANAKKKDVDVQLVLNGENVGCSTARNLGIERSSGDVVIFCDNDVALRDRRWARKLIDALLASPRRGVTTPKLLYPFEPHDIQCAGVAVSRSGRVQFRGRGARRLDPEFNRSGEAQAAISACCAVRRSVLDDVGGFDEIYNPVEFEDIDLCYKIRQASHAVWYVHDAEMYHFENVTTEGTPSLPNTYLIVKHGMIFKRRWRNMFENENGPDDAECQWNKSIHPRALADIGELEIL